jgi:hypothetical protein
MQYLLDFIHEHTLEHQLYLSVRTSDGDLDATCQRQLGQDDVWAVRPRDGEAPAAVVHYGDLLEHLEERGADMAAIERELRTIIATQIAFADSVLRDATHVLGRDVVQRTVADQRGLMRDLQITIERLTTPAASLALVDGGGAQTAVRAGHLTLVR